MRGGGGTEGAAPRGAATRQPRGRERVERILDAAAQIIAECGVAAATMHEVAMRSETSTGSMYHFFPDRTHLLDALERRHREAIEALAGNADSIDDQAWRDMPTASVMPALVGPFLAYLDDHRDALEFVDIGRWPETDRAFLAVLQRVLNIRLAPAGEGVDALALTMHAVMAGTFRIVSRLDNAMSAPCRAHIPQVLTAYLIQLENG